MADHAHNLSADLRAGTRRGPVGIITRGTTAHNRLRRCDRWLIHQGHVRRLLRSLDQPVVVDVGYGASDATTREWARWLRSISPRVDVVGLEINPSLIFPSRDGVRFEHGGFELAGYRPHLVRAFNVLRQYDVSQVRDVWELVTSRMDTSGLFIEGTSDELGRRCCWITLDASGPQTFTAAWDPFDCESPSDVAERLPKALIHRNVPGELIHRLLRDADAAWNSAAPWAVFGPRIRWRHALEELARDYPLRDWRRPVRDNVLCIDWSACCREGDI